MNGSFFISTEAIRLPLLLLLFSLLVERLSPGPIGRRRSCILSRAFKMLGSMVPRDGVPEKMLKLEVEQGWLHLRVVPAAGISSGGDPVRIWLSVEACSKRKATMYLESFVVYWEIYLGDINKSWKVAREPLIILEKDTRKLFANNLGGRPSQ
jgi:hypothetical protein